MSTINTFTVAALYGSAREAAAVAAELRLYETEGWTYTVCKTRSHDWKIYIADEVGEFVSFWLDAPNENQLPREIECRPRAERRSQ